MFFNSLHYFMEYFLESAMNDNILNFQSLMHCCKCFNSNIPNFNSYTNLNGVNYLLFCV